MESRAIKLSFSKVDTYEWCPKRYWYLHEPDAPKIQPIPSPHLSFGTSLHAALKNIYQRGGPPAISLAFLPEIIEDCWVNAGYSNLEEEKEAKEKALQILENFVLKNRSKPIRSIYIEKYLEAKVEGLVLQARFDRVDILRPGLLIVDYKTGSGKLSPNQLYISYLILSALERSPSDRPIKFCAINLEKNEEKLIEIDQEEAQRRIDRYSQIQERIIGREFPPTPSLTACRYCEARNICPSRRVWQREESDSSL